MIVSKITSKGQITLPKKVRDYLKVDPSGKIEFTFLEDGKVLVTGKSGSAQPLFGMLKHRKPPKPVSVEDMTAAIHDRRQKRNAP